MTGPFGPPFAFDRGAFISGKSDTLLTGPPFAFDRGAFISGKSDTLLTPPSPVPDLTEVRRVAAKMAETEPARRQDVIVTEATKELLLDRLRVEDDVPWATRVGSVYGMPVHVIPDGSRPLDERAVRVGPGMWLLEHSKHGPFVSIDLTPVPDEPTAETEAGVGGLVQLAAAWAAGAAVVGLVVAVVWRWLR